MTPVSRSQPEIGIRLLEYQRETRVSPYDPDFPLVLFISFSRVAAGFSLVSLFFPGSILWTGISFACMMLATFASIAHLSVPHRFMTMIINSQSYLVWEIRLAGALTAFLGVQLLSGLGWFYPYRFYFPWINFGLSILFLISTGWAYRFETHPAWRTSLLPLYYLTSALMIGLGLRSVQDPAMEIPFLFAALLLPSRLLWSVQDHLSHGQFLEKLWPVERWSFLAFFWTTSSCPPQPSPAH
jgi:DMSO reductase anchor subunit